MSKIIRKLLVVSVSLVTFLIGAVSTLNGQTPMVQVPIATAELGTATATNCGSSTAGYLAVNDGCPAAQTTLSYPYGLGVDSSGNVSAGSYGLSGVLAGLEVNYQGGSDMAGALVAAKQNAYPSFAAPMVGHSYRIAAGTTNLQANGGKYYCGSTTIQAIDTAGNGCPGQYPYANVRAVAVDPTGNIFFAAQNNYGGIRVFYVGGTAVANMISAYYAANCTTWSQSASTTLTSTCSTYGPTVTPQVGYIYALSKPQDFSSPRSIAVSVNPTTGAEGLYVDDNATTAPTTLASVQAATYGNQIKQFTGTGWATYIGSTTSAGSSSAVAGDGGPASSAVMLIGSETNLFCDRYENLYIWDTNNSRIRVVYRGGTTPPLYVEGNNATVIANPVSGNIYSVVGGGTLTVSGSLASALSLGAGSTLGMDAVGNLYFRDTRHLLWMESQASGISVAIGGNSSTSSGSTSSSPASGVACNGTVSPSVTGPLMTDSYADGCPATYVSPISATGVIGFDPLGNFYETEQRTTSTPSGLIRRYAYGNQFGLIPIGQPATDLLAFTPKLMGSVDSPTATIVLTGSAAAADYTMGLPSPACLAVSGYATTGTQTCTYELKFTPSEAGSRYGSLTLTQSGSVLISVPLGGIGAGAEISNDPGSQTFLTKALSVSGVAQDQVGNIFIADTGSGGIFEATRGAAPVLYAAGFSKPAQVAITGAGNILVADAGTNRVDIIAPGTPVTVSTYLATANGISLKAPSGVAVDLSGNIFISDTGNNRVLEVPATNNASNRVLTLGLLGLNAPMGLGVDSTGNLFVADSGNARVVQFSTSGIQSSVSVSPSLSVPVGVALDAGGDLYVADQGTGAIVMIPAGSSAGIGVASNLTGLNGLSSDGAGNLSISAGSSGLLQLNRSQVTTTYPQTMVGQTSAQVFTLTDTGNIGLTFGSPIATGTDSVDYQIVPSSTSGCTPSGSLASGAQCGISVTFQPQSVGASIRDSVTFPTSTATNSPQISLAGPPSLGLVYIFGTPGSTPNTINVAFTATLSNITPTTPINGSVTFTGAGGTNTVPVTGGEAVLNVALQAGVYTVTATYAGTTYAPPVTASVTLTVVTGTSSVALALTQPSGSITYGQPIVVTAVTTTDNSSMTPTGSITFSGLGLPTTTIPFSHTVTDTFTLLPTGSYTVLASYSGDSNYVPSKNTISFVVNRASPIIALVPTANVGNASTITLTGTLLAQPTYPSGTISFSYGSTTIGAAVALVKGVASVSTTSSALSSFAFTAAYSGDANFLPTSIIVTPPPSLVLVSTPSSLTTVQNNDLAFGITLTSFYGYNSSAVTVSCSGLPAYTVCGFSPAASTVAANQTVSVALQLVTNASSVALQSRLLRDGQPKLIALAGVFCLLVPISRRRSLRLTKVLAALAILGAMSGCGTGTDSTTINQTPTGIYTIMINATDGTSTFSVPVTLVVNPGPLANRPG